MNPEVKRLWVDALRSGEYERGERRLCTRDPGKPVTYCCLGVLSEIAAERGVVQRVEASEDVARGYRVPGDEETHAEFAYLHPAVQRWAGLDDKNPMLHGVRAGDWNDAIHTSFNSMAEIIEEQL